jgi:hypothetical protein
MAAYAFLHAGEAFGIRRWLSLVVTNVDVNERSARLECFVRGLDLLGDADGDRRVLCLPGQRTRDRDADDERLAGRDWLLSAL